MITIIYILSKLIERIKFKRTFYSFEDELSNYGFTRCKNILGIFSIGQYYKVLKDFTDLDDYESMEDALVRDIVYKEAMLIASNKNLMTVILEMGRDVRYLPDENRYVLILKPNPENSYLKSKNFFTMIKTLSLIDVAFLLASIGMFFII